MHLQNAGAAEHRATEKKGRMFPATETTHAGKQDWRGSFPSPVAQLELDHLLQSLVLFLHPDNSFDVVLQTGLGQPPVLGSVQFIFSISTNAGSLWFLALVCAVGGGSTGNVQDRAGGCEGRHVSLGHLSCVPELFGASDFPSVGWN